MSNPTNEVNNIEHDPSVVPKLNVPDPWTIEKATAAIPDKSFSGSTSPVQFFHIIERLKTTKREGWKRYGIMHGESVADHSFRMAIMSLFAPPSLDKLKCMSMCLVHDLAESLVGDITPADGVPKPEKRRREEETMDFLTGKILGGVAAGTIGKDVLETWKEFEEGQTMESKFAQDVDKVEMLLQMLEFERRGDGYLDLNEFTYVESKLLLADTQAWAAEILQCRKEFWLSRGVADKEDSILPEVRKMQDQYYGNTSKSKE